MNQQLIDRITRILRESSVPAVVITAQTKRIRL